jgi:DNA polymerase/3'-5' exonuclease PolX
MSNKSGSKLSRAKDIDAVIEQERKTKSKDLNATIIKWFRLLLKQLEFYVDVKTGKDKLIYSYKLNSIRKAYKVIRNVDHEITSGKELMKFKNIGKGTAARIDEILETGALSEVNDADISGAHLEYVEDLMKIFGIGRVKAYELYTVHGIKSIDELRKALDEGVIDLPDAIKIGLKYVDQLDTRIPRAEMDKINSFLIYAGIEVDSELDIRVCGSYRREAPFSGDIDVIVSHPAIETKEQAEESNMMLKFIDHLSRKSFIVDSLTSIDAKTKYMGLCRFDSEKPVRRIDIRFMPQESYYTAILYFTGSGDFNKRMRGVAQSLGYTLNEYQLTRLSDNEKIPITREKDAFDALNMEYQIPANRR